MSLPSYDELRREAKRLHRDAESGDPAAIERLAAHGLPRAGGISGPEGAVDGRSGTIKRADCLHVIARERGYRSWPRLKLHLKALGMSREDRVWELEECLADGQHYVVEELLDLDPGLPHAHFGIELALVDEATLLARLSADPGLAVERIGRRTPLLHLCFSKHHQKHPELVAASVRVAERLVELGADPNDRFDAGDLSALYGGHAGNLPLAHFLLEHGADPNDNESLYHATELDHNEGIRLLYKHGVRTTGTNALFRVLDRENPEGLAIMLKNGADPNEPLCGAPPCPAKPGMGNSLHHAARRMRSGGIIDMLLAAGADPNDELCGHTAYAIAAIYGNTDAMRTLAAAAVGAGGAVTKSGARSTPELSATEAFVAAIVGGRSTEAEAIRRREPSIMSRLDPIEAAIHTALAVFPGQLPALRRLHHFGFDPRLVGDGGMPAFHHAAWRGDSEVVDFYIREAQLDLEWENRYGGTLLSTAIHGSAHCPAHLRVDHLSTIRLILAAGGKLRPDDGDLTIGSEEVRELLLEVVDG